jgi:hypothetical protein
MAACHQELGLAGSLLAVDPGFDTETGAGTGAGGDFDAAGGKAAGLGRHRRVPPGVRLVI